MVLAKSCQPHEAKHAETDRSVSACVADLHARARKAAEGAWVYGEEWSTANVCKFYIESDIENPEK